MGAPDFWRVQQMLQRRAVRGGREEQMVQWEAQEAKRLLRHDMPALRHHFNASVLQLGFPKLLPFLPLRCVSAAVHGPVMRQWAKTGSALAGC